GFRCVDTLILKESEPVEWRIRIEDTADLSARVVRSNRGKMQIPELGISIDPGPACEACITNVEGILCQVEDVIGRILTWAEGTERERAMALVQELGEVRNGRRPVTIILSDPSGNSAIISNKAVKRQLQEEPVS
ncbi:MAG: ZPR1 zinc finger domain-containing protein, partial [Methanomicrobiales archaeon]|nr:ZPR1 zinc finger domain-containing protein [Methanomicrobiales archaeon]